MTDRKLEEQDEGNMPAIMKHCVVDLVDEEGHDVSRAFAICTESYQDDGYLKDDSHELTDKGKALEREHENADDHEDKVERYKSIIGESFRRDVDRTVSEKRNPDLVERAADLVESTAIE